MGVQKTYGYATSKGVAGGIYDMFHYPVDSRFNEEATGKLHFGVGVVTGKVPGSGVALPTSASTADMLPLWATSWTKRAKMLHCRP